MHVPTSEMGVKRLAFTHMLQGIDDTFIYAMGNAIGLYADSYDSNTIENIVFAGCCFTDDIFAKLFDLNQEGRFREHRELEHQFLDYAGMQSVRIDM